MQRHTKFLAGLPAEAAGTSPSDSIAVSPADAARLAGVGRTFLYAAISSGDLRSTKIGSRRIILVEALLEWLKKHEAVDRSKTSNTNTKESR